MIAMIDASHPYEKVCEVDYLDTAYASITAPEVIKCEVFVDDELIECVFVGNGGSHSWWTNAGGKLLPPHGLRKGQTLKIKVTGWAALRIDWPID